MKKISCLVIALLLIFIGFVLTIQALGLVYEPGMQWVVIGRLFILAVYFYVCECLLREVIKLK